VQMTHENGIFLLISIYFVLLFGSVNTIIFIDILYNIVLPHVSAFRPSSGIKKICCSSLHWPMLSAKNSTVYCASIQIIVLTDPNNKNCLTHIMTMRYNIFNNIKGEVFLVRN
jgi:hypothetical protein